MKFYSGIKKFLRWFGIIFLSLFIVANLVVLVTGKFYLYKAVWYTYLHGQKGPGIYDKDYFYSRELQDANKPDYWHKHSQYNQVKADENLISELEGLYTTSYLVIQNDKIIYERYWDDHTDQTVSNSFSMAKSIISMLIGIAIDEGKIKSIDQKVYDFIPSYKENGRDVLTLRHLLTMSAALDWSESGGNPFSDNAEAYYGWDLKGMIEDVEMNGEEPGKKFVYQSGATMILGLVLENATGMKVTEYANKKIWEPIRAENKAYWSLDHEDGLEKAYCCFYATTRDFARIGRIMMDDGVWNYMNPLSSKEREEGLRIISSKYVKESVEPADLVLEDGKKNEKYGLKWWLTNFDNHKVFYARGILGQYIICIPDWDVIIVRTGHKRGEKTADDHPSELYTCIKVANGLIKQL